MSKDDVEIPRWPMTVEAGQTWRLWVYEDAYQECLHIEQLEDGWASGTNAEGAPFVVGVARLEERGELVE